MTTLRELRQRELSLGDKISLNGRGLTQITKALEAAGMRNPISSERSIRYWGLEPRSHWSNTDIKGIIEVPLKSKKGKTVQIRVHADVDYFNDTIIR